MVNLETFSISDFETDYYKAHAEGISLNPILNAFQATVKKYGIDDELVQAFLKSMKPLKQKGQH